MTRRWLIGFLLMTSLALVAGWLMGPWLWPVVLVLSAILVFYLVAETKKGFISDPEWENLRRLNDHQKQKAQLVQAQWQAVMAHAQVGIVLLDHEGIQQVANEKANQIVDRLWVHLDEQQKQTLLALGHLNWSHEGRVYELVLTSVAQSYLIFLLDVSERVQAERLRREFTANLSHELKTPIQTILGASELLKHGLVQPEDVADFGQQIYQESMRMQALVQDVLSLAYLEEGMPVHIQLLDVEPILVRLIERLKKDVPIRLEVKSSLWVDARLFEMVAQNLISNAVKYTQEGAIDVVVTPNRLLVKDTGVGIPVEAQSRIFERFYRADLSQPGTGLGLAIVKHALALMNATIGVQSSRSGSSFVVDLKPSIPASTIESE